MAKNWKVGEAVLALRSGVKEDIIDVGRRFPLFTVLGAQVNQAGLDILLAMPDYMTARKVESLLKGDAQDPSEDGGEDEGSTPTPAAKPEKTATPAKTVDTGKINAEALAGKTPKELYTIAVELGIAVETKQPSEIYIKAIKTHVQAEAKKAKEAAAAATKAAKSEPKVKATDDDWDDEPAAKPETKKPAAKSDDDEWDI